MSDKASFKTAVQECEWAIDEFDLQVRDPCGDVYAMDDDIVQEETTDENELPKYNYAILANTEPETGEDNNINAETDEEGDELYATDGLLDLTAEGLRDRKTRLSLAKKVKGASARKAKIDKIKKDKADAAKLRKEKVDAKKAAAVVIAPKKRKRKSLEPTVVVAAEGQPQEGGEAETPRAKKRKRRSSQEVADMKKVLKEEKLAKKLKRRSNYIDNKKARAKAKVKVYLTKLIQQGHLLAHAPTPTAGPGGSMEVSGLMGMSLAFRAAAGEIRGADPRDATEVRPWECMDINTASSEQERCAILQTQIELLEEELDRMEMDQHKREGLINVWSKVKNEFGQSLNDRNEAVEKERSMSLDEMKEKAKKGPKKRRGAPKKTSSPKPDPMKSNDAKSGTPVATPDTATPDAAATPQHEEVIAATANDPALEAKSSDAVKANGDEKQAPSPSMDDKQRSESVDDSVEASGGSSVSDVNSDEEVDPPEADGIMW
jgi:hypothetical protein